MATATETPTETAVGGIEEFTKGLAQVFDEKARTLTEAQSAPARIAAATAPSPAAAPETETEEVENAPAAKTPVTTKPTVAKPVADLPAGGVKSAQWKEVKEERDKMRGRVTELEAKLKEVESRSSQYSDYEETKKKLEQYQATLREVAAERDPELTAPIIKKMQEAAQLAKTALPAEFQDEALGLMQQPPSEARDNALEKILETLPTIRRTRVERAITEMEDAQRQRGQLAEQSQQAIQRRQQAEEQRRMKIQEDFKEELAEWSSEKGPEMFREIPGNKEHNARAREIQENARLLFSGAKITTREFARASMWTALAPHLAEQNSSLMQQISELNEQINKLKGTSPGLGDSGSATTESTPDTKPDGMPLSEWLVKNAMREGITFGTR